MPFLFWLLLGFAFSIGFGCIVGFCVPPKDESFAGASIMNAEFWYVTKHNQYIECTNLTCKDTQFHFLMTSTQHPFVYKTEGPTVNHYCIYVPSYLFAFFHNDECIVTYHRHASNDAKLPAIMYDHECKYDGKYRTHLFYEDVSPYCPTRVMYNKHSTIILQEQIKCDFLEEEQDIIGTNKILLNPREKVMVDPNQNYKGILLSNDIWFSKRKFLLTNIQ